MRSATRCRRGGRRRPRPRAASGRRLFPRDLPRRGNGCARTRRLDRDLLSPRRRRDVAMAPGRRASRSGTSMPARPLAHALARRPRQCARTVSGTDLAGRRARRRSRCRRAAWQSAREPRRLDARRLHRRAGLRVCRLRDGAARLAADGAEARRRGRHRSHPRPRMPAHQRLAVVRLPALRGLDPAARQRLLEARELRVARSFPGAPRRAISSTSWCAQFARSECPPDIPADLARRRRTSRTFSRAAASRRSSRRTCCVATDSPTNRTADPSGPLARRR